MIIRLRTNVSSGNTTLQYIVPKDTTIWLAEWNGMVVTSAANSYLQCQVGTGAVGNIITGSLGTVDDGIFSQFIAAAPASASFTYADHKSHVLDFQLAAWQTISLYIACAAGVGYCELLLYGRDRVPRSQ